MANELIWDEKHNGYKHKKPITHKFDPMTAVDKGLNRGWGHAADSVKREVIDSIIYTARDMYNLPNQDIANLLAFAQVESGFNPSASVWDKEKDKSSASGVFQITDETGHDFQHRLNGSYKINHHLFTESYQQFDMATNIEYGIAVYLEKKRLTGSSNDVFAIYQQWNPLATEHDPLKARLEQESNVYLAELNSGAKTSYGGVSVVTRPQLPLSVDQNLMSPINSVNGGIVAATLSHHDLMNKDVEEVLHTFNVRQIKPVAQEKQAVPENDLPLHVKEQENRLWAEPDDGMDFE